MITGRIIIHLTSKAEGQIGEVKDKVGSRTEVRQKSIGGEITFLSLISQVPHCEAQCGCLHTVCASMCPLSQHLASCSVASLYGVDSNMKCLEDRDCL